MSEPVSVRPRRRVEKHVCRACMLRGDDMKPLCDTTTVEKLVFCTGIQIAESDGLPAHICHPCTALLDSAYNFKTTCLNTDVALRETAAVKLEEEWDSDRIADWPFDDECGVDKELDDKQKKQMMKKVTLSEAESVKNNGDTTNVRESTKNKKRGRKKMEKDKLNGKLVFDKSKILDEKVFKIKIEPEVLISEPLPEPDVNAGKPVLKSSDGLCAEKRRRPLWCDICQIKFPDKKAAQEHASANHKGDLSCVCEYCGKFFEKRSSRYYHLRSHLPPTHFCGQCSYATWHKHDLEKHKRIHTDVKRYQCEFCAAAYHTVSNLRSHARRTHERRRDHACPICAHRFFDKRKMLQHLDSHNDIKRFTCSVCGAALSRRNYWVRHMMRQHGVRVETPRPGRQKINYVVGTPTEGPLVSKVLVNRLEVLSEAPLVSKVLGSGVNRLESSVSLSRDAVETQLMTETAPPVSRNDLGCDVLSGLMGQSDVPVLSDDIGLNSCGISSLKDVRKNAKIASVSKDTYIDNEFVISKDVDRSNEGVVLSPKDICHNATEIKDTVKNGHKGVVSSKDIGLSNVCNVSLPKDLNCGRVCASKGK